MQLLSEGVTGGIGGLIGRSVAFPFDTLKVKLSTAKPGDDLAKILKTTMQEEGVLGLYRGWPWSAIEAMIQKFLYVFFFEAWKAGFRTVTGKDVADVSALVSILFGYLSDLQCVPFCVPVEAMVVRLQSAPANASRVDIIRDSLFTWEGFVKGLKSGKVYLVFSLKPGIEFAIFDRIKQKILEDRGAKAGNLSAADGFKLGAVARAIATVIMYPCSRGKSLAQAQLAPTALAALQQVLRTEGFLGIYTGLVMELMRGVTQSAVMFAVMEHIRNVVRRLLQPSLR